MCLNRALRALFKIVVSDSLTTTASQPVHHPSDQVSLNA